MSRPWHPCATERRVDEWTSGRVSRDEGQEMFERCKRRDILGESKETGHGPVLRRSASRVRSIGD